MSDILQKHLNIAAVYNIADFVNILRICYAI